MTPYKLNRTLRTSVVGLLILATLVCLGQVAFAQAIDPDIDPRVIKDDDALNFMRFGNTFAEGGIGRNLDGNIDTWWFGTRDGEPGTPNDNNALLIPYANIWMYTREMGEQRLPNVTTGSNALEGGYSSGSRSMYYTLKHTAAVGSTTDFDYTVTFTYRIIRDVAHVSIKFTNDGPRARQVAFRIAERVFHYEDQAPATIYFYNTPGAEYSDMQELVGPAVPTEWFLRAPWYHTGDDAFWRARQPLMGNATRPDRILFANADIVWGHSWANIFASPPVSWESLRTSVYTDFRVEDDDTRQDPTTQQEGLQSQFAVGLYYGLQTVGPKLFRTIDWEIQMNASNSVTAGTYGLGVTATDNISYKIGDNPATTAIIEQGYFVPSNATVAASVYNDLPSYSPPVSATIMLGDGLELAEGALSTQSITALDSPDSIVGNGSPYHIFQWNVVPTGTVSGWIPVTVTATFGSVNAPTLMRTLTSTRYINVAAPTQHTYQRGLHLTSFPYEFSDPRAAFALNLGSAAHLAWYDPETKYYLYTDDGITLVPGRGYWLELPEYVDPTAVQLLNATPLSIFGAHVITLRRGWNLIGSPYQYSIEWRKCQIDISNTAIVPPEPAQTVYTIDEAVQYGMLRPELWTWDSTDGAYALPDAPFDPHPQYVSEMRPYVGYWVYAETDCLLRYIPNWFLTYRALPSTAKPGRVKGSANEWQVNLTVEAGAARDTVNAFGVRPGGADAAKRANLMEPPISPTGLSSYFIPAVSDTAGNRLAAEYQAPGTTNSWTFVVECRNAQQQVSLRWPDLTQVPRNLPVMLTDLATGEQVYMRTSPGYTFNSGTGGTRRFAITVGGVVKRLAITSLNQRGVRGAGVDINYNLTQAAAVTVKIRTLSGKVVRTLSAGKLVNGTVHWDGRDEHGTILPPGTMYLCELTAVGADQQRINQSVTIRLK